MKSKITLLCLIACSTQTSTQLMAVNNCQSYFELLRAIMFAQIGQASETDAHAITSIDEAAMYCSKCCTNDHYNQINDQTLEENNATQESQNSTTKEKRINQSTGHAAYPKGCEPDRDCKKADDKAVPTLDQVSCECIEDFKAQILEAFAKK